MKYCPQCGAERQRDWRFCPQCRHDLASTPAVRAAHPRPLVGLVVFAVLVLAGVGAWVRILSPKPREGPPGSPTPPAAITATAAAPDALPEGHPPVDQLTLPDDIKKFIADLVAETEKQPNDVAAWSRLSQVQYRAAQIDSSYRTAALASFQQVLEIEPGNPEAIRGVANVQYDLGNYRDALPHFEKVVALKPDDEGAQTDLATVRMHIGDVERAIADYRRIIAANPTLVQAHYNLGIALHQQGDDAGALAAFKGARDATTDDRVRERIAQAIAQLEGKPLAAASDPAARPPGAGGDRPAPGAAAAPVTPGATAYQQTIERFFRTHEIVGPKVAAIEWPAPTSARVVVRDFPMSAMPPFARTKFTTRIRDALREAKSANGVSGAVVVEIVDGGSGTVMEQVSE
jgi:Flp pilus assembly protein TadD